MGIVLKGFKYFVSDFTAENILDTSITYLFMGLVAGVFYREFTKYFGFNLDNHLAKLHVHTLTLGFIIFIVMYLLLKDSSRETIQGYKKPFHIYNIGLITTLAAMTVYGIFDVVSKGTATINIAAISGISGIGHIILAVGLVWSALKIRNEKEKMMKRIVNTILFITFFNRTKTIFCELDM